MRDSLELLLSPMLKGYLDRTAKQKKMLRRVRKKVELCLGVGHASSVEFGIWFICYNTLVTLSIFCNPKQHLLRTPSEQMVCDRRDETVQEL